MAQGGEDDDKSEEPTEKKLQDARDKGDVVYSAEVGSAFSLLAVTLIAAFMVAPMASDLGDMAARLLANASRPMDGGALRELFISITLHVAATIGVACLLLMIAGIVSRYVQDKAVLTSERLKPQLSKLNPIEGFGRVFGMEAVAQFLKSFFKFIIVGAVVVVLLWPHDAELENLASLDVAALGPLLLEKSMVLLIACVVAVTCVAAADYLYTRFQHRKRHRMSQYDIKQEFKQTEGSPEVRAKLRQIRHERAARRMMSQVPQSTLVITNPTHYAVALRYDKEDAPVPKCLAKGVDAVAMKIREIAEEHNIPIIEDPPLARALYASAELDEVIPRAHFESVAKIIGYVMRLAERRRARGGRGAR
jgi:flagellar biosynthesis protein FlhB